MPADEYKTASSGSLKLKGVNPSSKVSKHKKKRPKTTENAHVKDATLTDDGALATLEKGTAQVDSENKSLTREQSDPDADDDGDTTSSHKVGKTEAELRHEERRRRRVGYIFL